MTAPCCGQVERQLDLSVFSFEPNAIILDNDFQRNAYRLNTASHNILKKSDLLDR